MPPRLKSFSYIGPYRYFLTYIVSNRRRAFVSERWVELVKEQIARAAREEQMAVVAYCFMPDHLHLLVIGEVEGSDCKTFIVQSKRYSAFAYRQQSGERLWQRGSHERILRTTEATLTVARYILENPIRAGLVSRVEDYPFLGSMVYTLPELLDSIRVCPSSSD